MSGTFVPVDLDKLLNDFEEQDAFSPSVPSQAQRQTAQVNHGSTDDGRATDDRGITERPGLVTAKTLNGLPSNSTNTSYSKSGSNCNDLLPWTSSDCSRTNEINSSTNLDLLLTSDSVSNGSVSSSTTPQSNGNVGRKVEHEHYQRPENSGVANLLDLADVGVSRPSFLNEVNLLPGNVGPRQTAPDVIKSFTDKRPCTGSLSPSNLLNDLSDIGASNHGLPNSLHKDLLLVDLGSDMDSISNSICAQTSVSNENVSAIEDPNRGHINITALQHRKNESSLLDLTAEDTKAMLPVALIDSIGFPTESAGESLNQNLYRKEHNKNSLSKVEGLGYNCSGENSRKTSENQTFVDQATVPANNLVASTTNAASGPRGADIRTSEHNGVKEVANTPALTEEGTSLLFMQDHFGELGLSRDATDSVNTSSNGTDEHNTLESVNGLAVSEINGTPETISVAQDAFADAPDEASPLGSSYEVLEDGQAFHLGYSAPPWLPDNNVSRCMSCQCKFTVVKRRHHCRACGKIFCSACCNLKFNLHYLEDKLARVCQACANVLLQRQAALTNRPTSISSNDEASLYVYLNPDQPQSPVEQRPSDDVEDVVSQTEQPPEYEEIDGQNFTPVEVASVVDPVFGEETMPEAATQITEFRPATCSSSSSLSSADIPVTSAIPLPPLLRKTETGLKIDNSPNHQELLHLLKKRKETVTFLLNKNLVVKVKIVKLNCCVKKKCWCFSSEGMQAADQEDMVILLECIPNESSIPQDVLSHFNTAFAYAKQGHRVTDLGYTIFGQPFLGSLRNAGFLYIKSSFQCLDNLVLPSGPHIFGILIQREEVSWVQLFPIRLILRLGAEYRYYPCPLWSVRDRQSLYGEIGHTIMDLLADFKNFQYTLPRVTGMHVHLEDKKVVVQLPQNRYDEVLKVLNATDEFVMAFEATFSNVADSHLVCIQEGTAYKTQSINLEGQDRKITGASFIVFNGALKSTTDVKAKVSIVEDGVMVQMVKQLSEEMRQAMRAMSDFTIHTGCPDTDSGSVQEVVFEWVSKINPDAQSMFLSPIDGLTLGTTSDIKINTHFDFSTPSIFRLRWTQLFFLDFAGERPRNLPDQFKQTTADIAKACTSALRPYLIKLYQGEKRRIGLRVNLSADMVGYIIGSQGCPMPDEMASNLDNALVPAIHNAVSSSSVTPTSMEFLFNIVEMLS